MMKYIVNILLIWLLVGCNQKQSSPHNLLVKSNEVENSEYISSSPILINDERYEYLIKNDHFLMLLENEDTIVKPENFYFSLEIIDINNDQFLDLRVFIFSNTDNQCDTYLYDARTKHFNLITNTNLDFKKLEKSEFYYTYHAADCADYDWESDLGKIENNEFKNIGNISGYGCEHPSTKKKIEIRKISEHNNSEILVDSLNYDRYVNKTNNKGHFIQHYWLKNFKNFE